MLKNIIIRFYYHIDTGTYFLYINRDADRNDFSEDRNVSYHDIVGDLAFDIINKHSKFNLKFENSNGVDIIFDHYNDRYVYSSQHILRMDEFRVLKINNEFNSSEIKKQEEYVIVDKKSISYNVLNDVNIHIINIDKSEHVGNVILRSTKNKTPIDNINVNGNAYAVLSTHKLSDIYLTS